MLQLFRITAVLEGFSYLGLFAFTMPLKYWAGLPEYNIYLGYVHGFLFLAYIALAIVFYVENDLKLNQLVKMLLASILPFGTLYLDKYHLQPLAVKNKAAKG